MTLVEELARVRRRPPQVAKAIREAARVSQARLAAELGVDRVTVARWESGERRPRGQMLSRWMDLLDHMERAA
jgi:DNA-binding transcriptional regulator YiaG